MKAKTNETSQRKLLVAFENFKLMTSKKFSCSEEAIDEFLRTTNTGLVCSCPHCATEMKGIELIHYHCKKCDLHFTN